MLSSEDSQTASACIWDLLIWSRHIGRVRSGRILKIGGERGGLTCKKVEVGPLQGGLKDDDVLPPIRDIR